METKKILISKTIIKVKKLEIINKFMVLMLNIILNVNDNINSKIEQLIHNKNIVYIYIKW